MSWKKIGELGQDFARGIYNSIDNKAADKIIKSKVSKGVSKDIAQNMLNKSSKTTAFKLGQDLANSKPLSGISGSAKTYLTAKNNNTPVSLGKAIQKGHSKQYVNDKGEIAERLSKAKIAGTVATVGVAGRIATGGGIYRDRYGNVNLPGVPFI